MNDGLSVQQEGDAIIIAALQAEIDRLRVENESLRTEIDGIRMDWEL